MNVNVLSKIRFKTCTIFFPDCMNLTDYVVVLMHTCLPVEIIREILAYVRLPLMQYLNRMYLDRFMEEQRMSFRVHDLPYPVFSIDDIYHYLNQYIVDHHMRIQFSHYIYKMNGTWTTCFYYLDDPNKVY